MADGEKATAPCKPTASSAVILEADTMMLVEYGGQFSDFWSALKNPRTGLTCGFSKSSKGTWEPGLLCNHWH